MSKFALILCFFSLQLSFAQEHSEVREILNKMQNINNIRERAFIASSELLGKPFSWEVCGDEGTYDPKPLYDFSAFNCVTFVEPSLSFAFTCSEDPEEFLHKLKDIKYEDPGRVCFTTRNHFTSLHWHPNVCDKKYLKDITKEIFPDAPQRMKWLDVDKWYADKIRAVEESKDSDATKAAKIAELNTDSDNKKVKPLATLPYIPLKDMLSEQVQEALKKQKIVVVNMIKNEHTKVNIPVIVGHQAFIVYKDGELKLRHASSAKTNGGTVDVSLTEYVKTRQKDTTWPTLGFNVLGFLGE